MPDTDLDRDLVQAALRVRGHAFAPFSRYAVGAAIYAGAGHPLFVGCNVENASYGLTVCAERNAVGAMVAAGVTSFEKIAVATVDGASPCGACRQVLVQFGEDAIVLLVSADEGTILDRYRVSDLLPEAFRFHGTP
ncbi:MAG: cytidine deaminase [Planctomycetota bacterium]|nr:MAG: cytidine deaminase [Planctomycetota bacterium]